MYTTTTDAPGYTHDQVLPVPVTWPSTVACDRGHVITDYAAASRTCVEGVF